MTSAPLRSEPLHGRFKKVRYRRHSTTQLHYDLIPNACSVRNAKACPPRARQRPRTRTVAPYLAAAGCAGVHEASRIAGVREASCIAGRVGRRYDLVRGLETELVLGPRDVHQLRDPGLVRLKPRPRASCESCANPRCASLARPRRACAVREGLRGRFK